MNIIQSERRNWEIDHVKKVKRTIRKDPEQGFIVGNPRMQTPLINKRTLMEPAAENLEVVPPLKKVMSDITSSRNVERKTKIVLHNLNHLKIDKNESFSVEDEVHSPDEADHIPSSNEVEANNRNDKLVEIRSFLNQSEQVCRKFEILQSISHQMESGDMEPPLEGSKPIKVYNKNDVFTAPTDANTKSRNFFSSQNQKTQKFDDFTFSQTQANHIRESPNNGLIKRISRVHSVVSSQRPKLIDNSQFDDTVDVQSSVNIVRDISMPRQASKKRYEMSKPSMQKELKVKKKGIKYLTVNMLNINLQHLDLTFNNIESLPDELC